MGGSISGSGLGLDLVPLIAHRNQLVAASRLNYCHNQVASCSSCCGLHNLRLDSHEKQNWLADNTAEFLALNLQPAELVEYRRQRENQLQAWLWRPDIYVCPFLGWLDSGHSRSGCLLHPEGSPHRQISRLKNPRNFSFYGEQICQLYECPSKEQQLASPLFDQPGYLGFEFYSRLVASHTLWQILRQLEQIAGIGPEKLLALSQRYLRRFSLPITSFEQAPLAAASEAELWSLLGSFFDPQAWQGDFLQITRNGRRRGKFLAKIAKCNC